MLRRIPEREEVTPGVETGVRFTKSGFITSGAAAALAFLRGVSNEAREEDELKGVSTASILVACEKRPWFGSHVKNLGWDEL